MKQIDDAVSFIKSRDSRKPEIAIVLGSGLGKLGESIKQRCVIPYKEIPGFPVSTAVGHKGNLIIGELGGKTVMAMQGRFHFYEGYTMWQVTMAERVFATLGIKYLLVSNASGALNFDYKLGDLILIRDQINLLPSPLIGPNLDKFGPRFPDMSHPYSPRLMDLADKCASELGIKLTRGVYVGVTGPAYETGAECNFFRTAGGDAVGMSTVPEVIVARHCGLEVMGVSIITDEAHDENSENFIIDENEVVAAADKAADKMNALFTKVIEKICPKQ